MFKFLGSIVPECSSDVKKIISMASQAFWRLRSNTWTSRLISRKLKIRLYKALIVPIALYGAETWTTTITQTNALKVFEMKLLRAILGVTRRDRTRNADRRAILGVTETIEDTLNARRLCWFGHVVRRAETNLIKASYTNNFEGRQQRGLPPKRERGKKQRYMARRRSLLGGKWATRPTQLSQVSQVKDVI